jgi:glycerol-3-phosphate dehydrogenase (NAD(P)+)
MPSDLPDGYNGLSIGVIGAGSWGTVLADLLSRNGYLVELWAREPEIVAQVNAQHENALFLPGVRLAETLSASGDLDRVVGGKELVVMAVPSQHLRAVASAMTRQLEPGVAVVSVSKGIENETQLTMTGVLKEALGIADDRLAALSGPSFAIEVARRVPTVVTVAARRAELASTLQSIFATPDFRVYTSSDMTGVELGGAVKNVIAISAGIVDGLGLGLNTRAALITRGMAEIRRLGKRMGANPRTFSGLAGYGDLVLTCTGAVSRNHTVGRLLAAGSRLQEILSEMRMVAEGVRTARSVYELSNRLGVEMPISRQTYRILYEDLPPQAALVELMTRELRPELDDE